MKSRYSFLQRFNFETLYNTFLGLNPREQIFVLIGASLLVLFLFGLPLSLASAKLSSLGKQIEEGHDLQREIGRHLEQYRQVSQKLKAVESQLEKGFDATISSTLSKLAGEAGMEDRIQNIGERGATPSELFDEITVEVKLAKVTLPQLTDFLYKIEKHPQFMIRIKEIRIKRRFDNRQLLDVQFQASTYRLQQVGG